MNAALAFIAILAIAAGTSHAQFVPFDIFNVYMFFDGVQYSGRSFGPEPLDIGNGVIVDFSDFQSALDDSSRTDASWSVTFTQPGTYCVVGAMASDAGDSFTSEASYVLASSQLAPAANEAWEITDWPDYENGLACALSNSGITGSDDFLQLLSRTVTVVDEPIVISWTVQSTEPTDQFCLSSTVLVDDGFGSNASWFIKSSDSSMPPATGEVLTAFCDPTDSTTRCAAASITSGAKTATIEWTAEGSC